MSEQQEPYLMVPYSETAEVSVWVVDSHLQMFTNLPEETARNKAAFEPGHIYFFAEFAAEGTEEVKHEDHYRDAITGKFVSEEKAEANPDTTVHEES